VVNPTKHSASHRVHTRTQALTLQALPHRKTPPHHNTAQQSPMAPLPSTFCRSSQRRATSRSLAPAATKAAVSWKQVGCTALHQATAKATAVEQNTLVHPKLRTMRQRYAGCSVNALKTAVLVAEAESDMLSTGFAKHLSCTLSTRSRALGAYAQYIPKPSPIPKKVKN